MSLTLLQHIIRLLFRDKGRSDPLRLNLLRPEHIYRRLNPVITKNNIPWQLSFLGILSQKNLLVFRHIVFVKAELLNVIQDQT